MLFIHIVSLLIISTFSISSVPTWQPNTLLNSGQHKPIFSLSTAPSTFTITQTFNASFTSIPKVVLSLQGYKQTPQCGGCNVGFKSSISAVTTTGFTGSYTVYGSNMFFLHFMYLGVSPLANQYFVSYALLTFTSGNLVNTSSPSRVQTTLMANPTGQTFPTFPNNKIRSLVFLGGFKMNRGSTGTYINLTSSIVSPTSYSITIGTAGTIQIFQACYFRLAFDKTAVMNGYVNIIDEFAYEGINNSQLPTSSTITSTSFFYRNYLMGFNKIHILNTNTTTDLMMQIYITPQTIFSCNSTLGNFTNTLYNYVYADVFHHRKRICNSSTPYFYFETLLCYDVCPLRTFNVSTNQYCQKCFPNCLTCSGTQQNNCITCSDTSDFRMINSSSGECICKNGYFENTTVVCALCSPYCLTCQISQNLCNSCDLINKFRSLANNTCICIQGYFESNNPVCSVCASQCQTCSLTSSNCTSCDLANKFRTLVNNRCQCIAGYYEATVNSSLVCLTCHQTCLTCENSSTSCIQCKISQNRQLNATINSCQCLLGFFQTSINSPLICLACSRICLTCESSENFCTSCNQNDLRFLNSTLNTCQCNYGTFQLGSNDTQCLLCHQNCQTCAISQNNCLSCNLTHNRGLTLNKTCSCLDGFYQNSFSSPLICLNCNFRCFTCLRSPTFCLSCNSSSLRILNTNLNTCQCITGYYQNQIGICLICNETCLTCIANSNQCTSCNLSLYRMLNTSSKSCICQLGYYEEVSVGICQPCSQPGCLQCHIQSIGLTETCDRCDSSSNYMIDILNSTTTGCKILINPQCGNGVVQPSEQCDDFNKQSGDGCTQTCKVEQMHKCQRFSNGNGTSLCYYSGKMKMQIQSIMKQLNSNRIKVIIKIIAQKCNLQKLKTYLESLTGLQVNFINRRVLHEMQQNTIPNQKQAETDRDKNKIRILQTNVLQIYSSNFYISDELGSTGYLGVTLNYTESIETLKNRNLKLVESRLETIQGFYFFNTPSSIVTLEDPHNKIPLKAFTLQQYQLANLLSYLFFALYILSLLFFIIFVFLRKSVIPIQNILIYQYAYFCVMGQKQVKLAISSLSYFGKYLAGFNIDILKSETSEFHNINKCPKLASIYQQCNPVDNINITFCLGILLLTISLIALCIKYRKQKSLSQTFKQEKSTKNQTERANEIDKQSITDSDKTYNQMQVIYEFPEKIRIALVISMEFFIGIVFLTSAEFLINAISLNSDNLIISLVWLGVVGVVFVLSWAYWYKNYPIRQLSYISIIKYQVSKFSISKFAYFIQFMFLIIWGAVISTAPGIVSYSLLLVWAMIWLYFVLFAKIYKSRIHTIRSTINQIITVLIVVIFVLMQFLSSDDMGLAYSIALMGLLLASLCINLTMSIYNEYLEKKIEKKLVEDQQALKNVEQEFKNYSSRKKQNEKGQAINNNFYAQETPSPQKMPLIQNINGSQSKTNQLRSFKKQLQMNVKVIPDEKKVQAQDTLRNINNSILYEQELSAIDDEQNQI